MRKISLLLIMCFSFFSLFGQPAQAFKSVDVEEFAKAVADSTYVVLDVRTTEEFAEGHIPGTDLNIDVLEGNFTRKALKQLPKDKSVALYCRSGNRSKRAAQILADNGYNVLELSTGIRGWAAFGKEVVR